MEIGHLISILEGVAPPELAEEMDAGRIGLIIEGRQQVERICCALDPTPKVVDAAIARKADVLVVHHTPLRTPVTSVRGPLAGLMRRILAAGLNLFVLHTNFDHSPGGINDSLADLLGLQDRQQLALGLVGDCTIGIPEVSERLACPLRVWGPARLPGCLAIAGGSGFSPDLLDQARDLGAVAFLSADLKHSVARGSPLPLIEATHYALEAPGMRMLAARMGWEFLDDPPELTIWTRKNSGMR